MPKNGTSAPPASRRLLSGCVRPLRVRKAQTCQRTARLRHPRVQASASAERNSAVQPPVSHIKRRASPCACPALRLSLEVRAGEPQRGEIAKPRPKVSRSHWRTEGLGHRNPQQPLSPERAIHACAHRHAWSAPVLARPFRAGRWERFAAPVPGRWPGLRYLAPLGLNELPLGLNPRPPGA